jgi:hypothetical protein
VYVPLRVADPDLGIFLTLDPGSWMEKFGSGIGDKHPGSAILIPLQDNQHLFNLCINLTQPKNCFHRFFIYIYIFPQTCPEFILKKEMWCPPVRQKVASIAVCEVSHNGVTHFMTVNSSTQKEKNQFKNPLKEDLIVTYLT